MISLGDLFRLEELDAARAGGYVREQRHPTLPLRILNYTEKAAYDGVWTDVTRQCRGLIYDERDGVIVARPFPKFFNYGQDGAPALDLNAAAVVTEKMDGSLGILYPDGDDWAIATRGSFTSEQAIHATAVWRTQYQDRWLPLAGVTHLFEIIYPGNRIVCDYEGLDDLVLLASLEIDSGWVVPGADWPGPSAAEHPYGTLADALSAAPRPGAEGFVVYFRDTNERVKIKQDDYVALHRILTGMNARHVWEVAAVQACADAIHDRKHWATYLGIDPARADEVLALEDDWLAAVPDEFYDWVHEVTASVTAVSAAHYEYAIQMVEDARRIHGRAERYEWLRVQAGDLVTPVMRLASTATNINSGRLLGELRLRCWRSACPEPTTPFARTEDVA